MQQNNMYISSDGTQKDVTTMNVAHIVNAIYKAMRTCFETNSLEEFNKCTNNFGVLINEFGKRHELKQIELQGENK